MGVARAAAARSRIAVGAPRVRARWAWPLVGVTLLLYVPTVFGDRSLLGIDVSNTATLGIGLATINFMLISLIGAVALNVLVGYAGLLSMGHSAFLAVGAFGAAVVGVQWGMPFWLTVPAAGALGAAVGIVAGLPSARVSGIYLLLSTLALNAIAIYGFLRYQLEVFGTAGVIYPAATIGDLQIQDDRSWYFVLLACAAIALLLSRNVLRTREGRAFVAVRDHDAAAAASGVNVSLTKLKAFAFTSFLVSASGALTGYYVTTASSESFTFGLMLGFYAMIVIGGLGSLLGAVLGAMVWAFVPAVLTTTAGWVDPSAPVVGSLLDKHRDDANLIIFGVLIIAVLIFRPDGLVGAWKSLRATVRRWPYSS